MIIVPMPLEFLAFAFAPQSLIAPFAALTIVLNQLFAPLVLPEELTVTKIVATCVIVAGLVIIALATAEQSDQMSTSDLLHRYFELDYLVPALALVALMGVVLCVIHLAREWDCGSATPLMYAFVAACFNAFLQTLSKSLGEMTRSTDAHMLFASIYPYLHIVLILALGMVVVSYVNQGLSRFDAVLFSPLYICCLIVLSSLYGSIFFKEYEHYGVLQVFLWILGVLTVCSGVMLLTLPNWQIGRFTLRSRQGRDSGASSYGLLEEASTSTSSNSDELD